MFFGRLFCWSNYDLKKKAKFRQIWAVSKNNPPENHVEPVPTKSELVSHSITVYLFLVSQKYQDVSVQVEIGE